MHADDRRGIASIEYCEADTRIWIAGLIDALDARIKAIYGDSGKVHSLVLCFIKIADAHESSFSFVKCFDLIDKYLLTDYRIDVAALAEAKDIPEKITKERYGAAREIARKLIERSIGEPYY